MGQPRDEMVISLMRPLEAAEKRKDEGPSDEGTEYAPPPMPTPKVPTQAELKRKKTLASAFGKDAKPGDKASKKKKPAPEEDDDDSEPEPAEGSVMSESQVRKMMQKRKRGGSPGRGSNAAKARIQKEQEEWESAKQNNPEYWKPPKFCQVLGKTTFGRGR